MFMEISGAALPKNFCVLYFWASWCNPCKKMADIFEFASDELERVNFIKINLDVYPDVGTQYEIQSIPTFIITFDNEIVDKKSGVMDSNTFLQWITEKTS